MPLDAMPHEPADPLRVVLEAHARTLATATARYSWRTPVQGPAHTTAHGHTDLTTGAATMTTVATGAPPPPADDGVLVLDGLIALPGQDAPPEEMTAHALLVPEDGTLTMVLLDGPPSPDDQGRWAGARADTPGLPMEVDALLGSVAATFHWLAAATGAEPGDAPGRYRVDLDLSTLVDDAPPHRRERVRLTLDRLHPGLSSASAGGVEAVVEIDQSAGLVTSLSVRSVGTQGARIDPVLLELRDHGLPAGVPPVAA
ncbi:hypothetical protein [Kineococcus sp. NPDC059986]|uniref:hypothetical protein n=1 Tax=Kineococcus sp. NPDC059986 TaxID=3155538 RepID=UPI00345008BF